MLTLADEVTPEQWEEYGLHLINILNNERLAKPDSIGQGKHSLKCVVLEPTEEKNQFSFSL